MTSGAAASDESERLETLVLGHDPKGGWVEPMNAGQSASRRSSLRQRLQRLLNYRAADPGNAMLTRDCAELHRQLGEIDAARALVESALAARPDDSALLFQLATLELTADRPARTCELLRELLARGVDNGGVRHNLAYALGLMGEPRAALDALAPDWERTRRDVPEAPLLKAKLQHHADDVAGAVATLKDFLLTAPDSIEAHGDLALLLIDSNDHDAAALHAQRALADGGDHYGARLAQGMAALAREDIAAARAIFETTVLRREERGRSWFGLGLCDLARSELARAEASLAEAVRLMPDWPGARIGLAWAQIGLQRLADAEATLREASAPGRDGGAVWGMLALVQCLRGDVDAARDSLAQADAQPIGAFAAVFAEQLLGGCHGDAKAALTALQQALGDNAGRKHLLEQLRALQRSGGTALQ